jgi:hypothetical protein
LAIGLAMIGRRRRGAIMGAKDPARLARIVVIWLYLWLAAEIAEGAGSVLQIVYLSKVDPNAPLSSTDNLGGDTADMFVGLVALAWLIVNLMASVLVLTWIYRVNRNAQLHADGMSVSPGWNVGFFFVPIMTWFRPYQGIRDSWQVSHDPENWPLVEVPPLLHWWWGCWVAYSILGSVSMRLSFLSSTVGGTIASLWLDLASGIVGIPLGLLLIQVVQRLTRAQGAMIHGSTFA